MVGILKAMTRRAGAGSGSETGTGYGSVSHWYETADLDPYQNVTDPQLCLRFNK